MTTDTQPIMPTPTDIRADFKARLDEILNASLENFSPERALEAATRTLANSRQQAVWNLLGLTDKWGKWEYDANRKDSPLSNWISSEIEVRLREFMNELILSELDNIKATLKKRIKSQMTTAVIEHVEWNTRRRAEEAANRIADELIKQSTADLLKDVNPED